MSRQECIEKICAVINDINSTQDDKDKANQLLNKVVSNQITEDEATTELDKIVNKKYWLNVRIPDGLFKSLRKYKNGRLDDMSVNKMVSSLVTRCLIEIEGHPGLDPKVTGIYDFLSYLNSRLYDQSEKIDLIDLLHEYGLIDKFSKEVESDEE